MTEYRCRRTSDSEPSGRAIEVANPETVLKIYDMVVTNQRLKVR